MKRWRRLALLAGVLIVLTVGGLYEASTHVVRGWLRGEAFYDGRPTSYWRNVILEECRENFFDPLELITKPQPTNYWKKAWDLVRPKNVERSRSLMLPEECGAVLAELDTDASPRIRAFAGSVISFRKHIHHFKDTENEAAFFVWHEMMTTLCRVPEG